MATCSFSKTIDIAEYLLEKGANVNASAKDRVTLLYLAASNGNLELVELLLNKGANIHARNTANYTPFYAACGSNLEVS